MMYWNHGRRRLFPMGSMFGIFTYMLFIFVVREREVNFPFMDAMGT